MNVLVLTLAVSMVACAYGHDYAMKGSKTSKGALPSTAALETTTPLAPPAPTAPLPEASTLPPPEPSTKKPSRTKKPKPATLPPVDYDCKGKRDGYYPDPKDKCSSKYFACVGGSARQMECAVSSLVYEPESKACERPEDSYRCSGARKSTLAPTSRRPLPPVEKLPIDCAVLADGWYAHPADKCSHEFFSCSNGMAARFLCAGNMYFDEPSNMCMAREDVEACGGKRPLSTKAPPTTKAPSTPKLPIDCSSKSSGYYPDPEAKCSPTYYACSGGVALKLTCPDGLFFDQTTGLCDYQDEVFDCTGKTKPPTKPTRAPKPSPASLPSDEFKCAGKADGGYTPESSKCSHVFFKCIAGNAYRFVCPNELYYDVDGDQCDHFANLFACTNRRPTTRAPTTTLKPKPTEKVAIDCSKLDDGDYPDPERKCCKTYYSCSGGVGSRRACPSDTFFDKELGLCDTRDQVPACSGKPRPLTTTPSATSKRPAEKYPFDCAGKKDGWYEDAKAPCSPIYWGCVGGSTSKAECPAGTIFDSEYGQCGYREEVPKCGGVRPTTEEP